MRQKKYKFTVIYFLFIVAPLLVFALVNMYIYLFTSNGLNPKTGDAFFVGAILGGFGTLISLMEADL